MQKNLIDLTSHEFKSIVRIIKVSNLHDFLFLKMLCDTNNEGSTMFINFALQNYLELHFIQNIS